MDAPAIDLRDHLAPQQVIDLEADTKDEALLEVVDAAALSGAVSDRDALVEAVRARERILSTGIGLGIAIPHARIASVDRFVVSVGRHGGGIDFESIDQKPVHIVRGQSTAALRHHLAQQLNTACRVGTGPPLFDGEIVELAQRLQAAVDGCRLVVLCLLQIGAVGFNIRCI